MSINFTFTRGFVKDVRQLRKRYRLIEDDIGDLLTEMVNENHRGDLVPSFGSEVYKVRIANRSARRGKRGGFRIIYRYHNDNATFLHIYSKSDKSTVSAGEIKRMLTNLV